jgi:hypothetical protein
MFSRDVFHFEVRGCRGEHRLSIKIRRFRPYAFRRFFSISSSRTPFEKEEFDDRTMLLFSAYWHFGFWTFTNGHNNTPCGVIVFDNGNLNGMMHEMFGNELGRIPRGAMWLVWLLTGRPTLFLMTKQSDGWRHISLELRAKLFYWVGKKKHLISRRKSKLLTIIIARDWKCVVCARHSQLHDLPGGSEKLDIRVISENLTSRFCNSNSRRFDRDSQQTSRKRASASTGCLTLSRNLYPRQASR